jgi:hypothetical protein
MSVKTVFYRISIRALLSATAPSTHGLAWNIKAELPFISVLVPATLYTRTEATSKYALLYTEPFPTT